jgi:hypothetical protein
MKKSLLISLLVFASIAISEEIKDKSNLLTDFFNITKDSQSDYPIQEIFQGCPKVDCIPSIDKPEFITASNVDFIKDNDLIMAVTIDGQMRVYPTTTLQQHEIVNDKIGKIPFAVTYCPLCGTGVVFSRKIKGEVVEFGVSGVLHGSDLVMYDRKNKNLWQQLTGVAFAGPDRGYQLESIPVVMTDWKTWKKQHPTSQVLSNSKDKINDHYGKYRSSDKIMFGGVTDPRLNPKRVIYGLKIGEQAIAIDFDMIKTKKHFELKVANTVLQIKHHSDGKVTITNKRNNSVYEQHRSYWFAWYTFNPKTLLFKTEKI